MAGQNRAGTDIAGYSTHSLNVTTRRAVPTRSDWSCGHSRGPWHPLDSQAACGKARFRVRLWPMKLRTDLAMRVTLKMVEEEENNRLADSLSKG